MARYMVPRPWQVVDLDASERPEAISRSLIADAPDAVYYWVGELAGFVDRHRSDFDPDAVSQALHYAWVVRDEVCGYLSFVASQPDAAFTHGGIWVSRTRILLRAAKTLGELHDELVAGNANAVDVAAALNHVSNSTEDLLK